MSNEIAKFIAIAVVGGDITIGPTADDTFSVGGESVSPVTIPFMWFTFNTGNGTVLLANFKNGLITIIAPFSSTYLWFGHLKRGF